MLKKVQVYERERLRSYRAYLESVEKDLFEKNKALRDFKKNQKIEKQESDEADNYSEYLEAQAKDQKTADIALEEFKRKQRRSRAIEAKRDFTEEEELGIFVERPRFDYKKRAMFGAKPKYKSAAKSGSGEGSGASYEACPFLQDQVFLFVERRWPIDRINFHSILYDQKDIPNFLT